MNNVTTEQVQQAKSVDLLGYLKSNEADNIHRVGN